MKTFRARKLYLFTLAAQFLIGPVFAQSTGDDLTVLNDEFNDASTLSQFQRVYQVEMWGANQLELFDINGTRPGMMVMMPFTSTWFNDYRGELAFKLIQGDFVVTTDVLVDWNLLPLK